MKGRQKTCVRRVRRIRETSTDKVTDIVGVDYAVHPETSLSRDEREPGDTSSSWEEVVT